MCRKGAWVESAAKVTVIRLIQSKACGFKKFKDRVHFNLSQIRMDFLLYENK